MSRRLSPYWRLSWLHVTCVSGWRNHQSPQTRRVSSSQEQTGDLFVVARDKIMAMGYDGSGYHHVDLPPYSIHDLILFWFDALAIYLKFIIIYSHHHHHKFSSLVFFLHLYYSSWLLLLLLLLRLPLHLPRASSFLLSLGTWTWPTRVFISI